MNLHTLPRVFYLTRHGQSEYNLLGKIGGDSGLTDAGRKFAHRLAEFAHNVVGMKVEKDEVTGEERRTPQPARLWTSTLRRTKETAQYIKHDVIPAFKWDNGDEVEWKQFQGRARRNLDELYAGICDGLTYKEIEEKYPEEFARRQEDKLTYRYPRGKRDVVLFRLRCCRLHTYICSLLRSFIQANHTWMLHCVLKLLFSTLNGLVSPSLLLVSCFTVRCPHSYLRRLSSLIRSRPYSRRPPRHSQVTLCILHGSSA